MIPQKQRLDPKAISLLILLCVIWGCQQVAVKEISLEIPPVLQAALRSAGAAALLLGWSLLRRRNLFQRDGSLRDGLIVGALFAFEFAFLYQAIAYASASHTVVMLYASPFFVALGAHFVVPGERLRRAQVLGLAVAFSGIVVAFADATDLPNGRELTGDALAVVAAVIWASITLLVKAGRLNRIAPAKTLFYQLGLSALFLPVLSLLRGESWDIHPDALTLDYLAAQIVIVAWLSYLAWFWLVQTYPAGRLAAFTFLTPLLGMLAGGVLLGERLSPRLGLAALLVSAGIYLVNRRPAVRPEMPVPGS